MSDEKQPNPLVQMVARMQLLTRLLQVEMVDRAVEKGRTPEEVLAYAETVRQFFEREAASPEEEMYMNAEVSSFFDELAQSLRKRMGNP